MAAARLRQRTLSEIAPSNLSDPAEAGGIRRDWMQRAGGRRGASAPRGMCGYSVHGRRAVASANAVQNCSMQFCRTLYPRGFSSSGNAISGELEMALPEGCAATPSMAAARLRQRTLSKFVPYEFVEPSTRVLNPSAPPLRPSLRNGAPRGIRTLVPALRGLCPRPLDDGSVRLPVERR